MIFGFVSIFLFIGGLVGNLDEWLMAAGLFAIASMM